MRTLSHRFLLMLLMLALPLQAFASASMLGCAFPHQTAMQAMATADDAMVGCHEHDSENTPPAQHDCQHCAACCMASALAFPAFGTPAIMPVPTVFVVHPAASFSGFIPDGPERPPRTPRV